MNYWHHTVCHIMVLKNMDLKNIELDCLVHKKEKTFLDVIKFLCLGADFVGIGRPAVHGLITQGNLGVKNIFEILNNELKSSMANGGFKNEKSFNLKRLKFIK